MGTVETRLTCQDNTIIAVAVLSGIEVDE
jgi:hypothetical protein